jgi:predicted dehydrogenase
VTVLRVGCIGAGFIADVHLAALARLGRTEVVGIASRSPERAGAAVAAWGGAAFTDPAAMLDSTRPDVAIVCVPPDRSPATGTLLVERGVPFLIEKPLAADDAEAPARLAAAIDAASLVVAVGYQLRALDALPDIRARLAERPPYLVLGRWLGGTPSPTWWHHASRGGGQIVEQATHLFDLARVVVGEATVVSAVSIRTNDDPSIDVADATTAILRFETGAIGTFSATRRLARSSVALEFASDGRRIAVEPVPDAPIGSWRVTFADAAGEVLRPPGRNPYDVQLEAFLDAVEGDDPSRVLCTYADALRTDRLTRAVVAATGEPG